MIDGAGAADATSSLAIGCGAVVKGEGDIAVGPEAKVYREESGGVRISHEYKFQVGVRDGDNKLVALKVYGDAGLDYHSTEKEAWVIEGDKDGILYMPNAEGDGPDLLNPYKDVEGKDLTLDALTGEGGLFAQAREEGMGNHRVVDDYTTRTTELPAKRMAVNNAVALGAAAWADGYSSVAIGHGAKAGGSVVSEGGEESITLKFQEYEFQVAKRNAASAELEALDGYEEYDYHNGRKAWVGEDGVLYRPNQDDSGPDLLNPYKDVEGKDLTLDTLAGEGGLFAQAREEGMGNYRIVDDYTTRVITRTTVRPSEQLPVNAIAIGTMAKATGENAIAIGAGVEAGENQIVIGSAEHSVMVGGHDVGATFTDHDTRIGSNTMDIGTNRTNITTNTMDIGTNRTNITTNTMDIGTNRTNIATNASDILNNKAGIAMAIALAHIPTASQGSRGSVGIGGGFFDGKEAIAAGASFRVGQRGQVKLGISQSSGETSGGVGLGIDF